MVVCGWFTLQYWLKLGITKQTRSLSWCLLAVRKKNDCSKTESGKLILSAVIGIVSMLVLAHCSRIKKQWVSWIHVSMFSVVLWML